MRKKIFLRIVISFTALIALTALLMAVPLSADTNMGCDPAGTWMETSVVTGEPPFMMTIIPMGRGRTMYAVVAEILGDSGFGSVASTEYRGIAIRTGHNTYDFTIVKYATNAAGDVVLFNVGSGTGVAVDCDHIEITSVVALYSPDQDPFGEEPPLYGCFPIAHVMGRVPVVPTCDPGASSFGSGAE